LSQISGTIPRNLFVTFSMTKGFGVAGGGVVVSDKWQEEIIRTYGVVYAFSAPLDYSSTLAAHAALDLHFDGTVRKLQDVLIRKVELFDKFMGRDEPFSPIRMVKIGSEHLAIEAGKKLLDQGFFTVTAFFPVVAMGDAQLRICISVQHTDEEIAALAAEIKHTLGMRALAWEEPAYAF
jgi:8-amino-7-oxononanoate synthase